jgi:PAS domain S-box-containing protein
MTARAREGALAAATRDAALSDLLQETDAFFDDLRDSNARLAAQRRRFGRLVLEQANALRGANASLSRDLDQLTRLQSIARFLAAPGPDGAFGDGLAETCARALDAVGAAIARRDRGGWEVAGRWRISRRNARQALPERRGEGFGMRPSARKDTDAWWIPVGGADRPSAGLVVLARPGHGPGERQGRDFVDSVVGLVAEGLAAHASHEAVLSGASRRARMLQTVQGGLLELDRDGRVAFANPALAEMLGRDVADIEGRPLADVFARDPHLPDMLGSALAGRPPDETETHVTSSHGRRFSVSLRISRLPEGILVLFSDLSRRREVEAERRTSDRLAALGRLSAGVAHEIRNPLAGIRAAAEILRRRVEPDRNLVRFTDVILEETARLDRIVESLLQFAKPPEPRCVPVRVADLLERARELAIGRASERGITIRVTADGALPEPLADRDQILQVLLNLLLNAIEASADGAEIGVTAGVEPTESPALLRLVVRDAGPGVPSSIRERIFDPFFTTKPGGTGLGLSISRNILHRHGGSLRVESEAGQGARAILTLPLPPPGAGREPGEAAWPTS